VKDISNIEYVLHHWRPIRIYTNKKDQKMVIIGYFDRKVNNSVRLSFIIFFSFYFILSRKVKERKNVYLNILRTVQDVNVKLIIYISNNGL